MRKFIIYKLTNPDNQVYIGQSCNIEDRLSRYRRGHCKKQHLLYNSFIKYGFLNHKVEILYKELNKEEADRIEIELIKEFKDNKNSLNLAIGGSIIGDFTSKEIFKISLEGKIIDKFPSIKEGAKTVNVTDVSIGKAILNKTYYSGGYFWIYTLDYKENMVFIRQNSKYKAKYKIYQFNMEKQLIKEYNSSADAARQTGYSQTYLLKCAKEEKLAFNYYWSINKNII